MRRKGVLVLLRVIGVGVEVKNGSDEELVLAVRLLHEEGGRLMDGTRKKAVDEAGDVRSSDEGGVIPSSVYSQSICTIVAES